MALAGVAYSCMVVSSFSRAQTRVLEMGFADDINTYVMISGNVIICTENRIVELCNFAKRGTSLALPSSEPKKLPYTLFLKYKFLTQVLFFQ